MIDNHEDPIVDRMAQLCSLFACDRALPTQTIDLPLPSSPECDDLFLATWAAYRHVTAELGRLHMRDAGRRLGRGGEEYIHGLGDLEAFERGRALVPSHIRWAETEAMLVAGEWEP